MLEFLEPILLEFIDEIYPVHSDKKMHAKKIKQNLESYILNLASDMDEINLHRSNTIKKLSGIFIEPRLSDKILSETYYFDYYDDPKSKYDRRERNPKLKVRKDFVNIAVDKSVAELLDRYNKLIILGQPGSGKTSILKKIVLDIASNECDNKFAIYLPLRNTTLRTTTILDFIYKQLKRYAIENVELLVEKLLKAGAITLLLDGIDEIPIGDRQQMLEDINDLVLNYPLNRFIATSRLSSYFGELSRFKGVEIRDFCLEESLLFVDKWFGADDKKNGLIKRLVDYPQIAEIANNPLLLSLICIVYDHDLEISLRRTELYNRCVACLMREWDAQRGFRRDSAFSKLEEQKRTSILSYLAFQLCLDERIYFNFGIAENYLKDIIQRYGLSEAEIPCMLEEIIDHYGLIIEVGKDVFSFSHLTFQEYFAANYVADKRLFLQDNFDMIGNPFWEEILTLCASILTDATEYLRTLLSLKHEEPFNIFLAGLSLSVNPVVDANLKENIVLLLLRIYHNDTNETSEKALRVLLKIDDTDVGNRLLTSLGIGKFYLDDLKKKWK